ncbi:hypothetical protein SAMN02745132_04423 [Enterovibrio nigricans DSM 22720]|uniref:Uncharacterized protein n=1 Tax=Enterovibrio nigricans DSM 22720 TaxID=1121868 RepID=A0A1T4VWM0_9GAMM|nr:hypothetical protein SAMN02745132_04423 [Enterovibrio nigricans DSM 22720]
MSWAFLCLQHRGYALCSHSWRYVAPAGSGCYFSSNDGRYGQNNVAKESVMLRQVGTVLMIAALMRGMEEETADFDQRKRAKSWPLKQAAKLLNVLVVAFWCRLKFCDQLLRSEFLAFGFRYVTWLITRIKLGVFLLFSFLQRRDDFFFRFIGSTIEILVGDCMCVLQIAQVKRCRRCKKFSLSGEK